MQVFFCVKRHQAGSAGEAQRSAGTRGRGGILVMDGEKQQRSAGTRGRALGTAGEHKKTPRPFGKARIPKSDAGHYIRQPVPPAFSKTVRSL